MAGLAVASVVGVQAVRGGGDAPAYDRGTEQGSGAYGQGQLQPPAKGGVPAEAPPPAAGKNSQGGKVGLGADYICREAARNAGLRAAVAKALDVEAAKIGPDSCTTINVGSNYPHGSWTKPGSSLVGVSIAITPAYQGGKSVLDALRTARANNPAVADAWVPAGINGVDGAFCSRADNSLNMFSGSDNVAITMRGVRPDVQQACPSEVMTLGRALVRQGIA